MGILNFPALSRRDLENSGKSLGGQSVALNHSKGEVMRHETKREAAIQANDKIQRIAEYEKDIEMEDVDGTRVGLARFINFANCLFIFHKNLFDNPFKASKVDSYMTSKKWILYLFSI